MKQSKNVHRYKFAGYFLAILIIGAGFYSVSRAQDIIDWWKLRDYSPSQEIAALATDSGMSEEGRRIFYVHDPQLLEKETFTESCIVGVETIVLGCYVNSSNIYVFDVDDVRLEGIEEVTAAHEMLHAVYDRLTINERSEIDEYLQQEFKKIQDDRILQTIDSYRNRGESVVNDELHSIIGTEVRDLPDFLEDHYAEYFEDRNKVLDLAQQYADEFRKREEKIESLDEKLESLQGEITRMEANLALQSQALAQERSFVESLSGEPKAYNEAAKQFNSKVFVFNKEAENLQGLIVEYNEIVKQRNQIAVEERELVEAIDTRVEEI